MVILEISERKLRLLLKLSYEMGKNDCYYSEFYEKIEEKIKELKEG